MDGIHRQRPNQRAGPRCLFPARVPQWFAARLPQWLGRTDGFLRQAKRTKSRHIFAHGNIVCLIFRAGDRALLGGLSLALSQRL